MFEKYNFNSILILTTLLTFIIGFCIEEDWQSHSISYPASVLALQLTSIGIYCTFIENEFFKAPITYQVFAVALVTGYQGGRSIEHLLKLGLGIDFRYANVGWTLTAVALYPKLPDLVMKCVRFDIGYALAFIPLCKIDQLSSYKELISSFVGFGFVALTSLNFERVSIITTVYCYSCMIVYGFETFIRQLPIQIDLPIQMTVIANIIIALIMGGGLYLQFKGDFNKERIASTETSYSTF